MNPKELYAEIMADKERYDFCGRGEKMADARDNDTYRIVILNKAKKRAYEFIDDDGKLTLGGTDILEQRYLARLTESAKEKILEREAYYWNGFYDNFKNGVACLCWTIQPDGEFYADGDGFGITDDSEIQLRCFIDRNCKIIIPFQPIDDMEKMNIYTAMAEQIAAGKGEYRYIEDSKRLPEG